MPRVPPPPSFLEVMEARSRGHATPLATNGQSPSSGSQSPLVPPSTMSTGSSSPGTPQLALQPPLHVPSACPAPLTPTEAPAPPPRRSIISRLFGTSPAAEVAPVPPGRPRVQPLRRVCGGPGGRAAPPSWPHELLPTGAGPFFAPGHVAPQPLRHASASGVLTLGCSPGWAAPGWALSKWELSSAVHRASPSCRSPRKSPECGGFCS